MDLDVVVIDDDAVVLFLHKVLIQKSSLPSNVNAFSNAGQALEFMRQRSTRKNLLIFLDINMPDINGWDFLDYLNRLSFSKKIFVVMVTSSINRSDRNRAEQYPLILDYLEKPLSKQACEELYMKLLPLL
ncbi:MAG: response regulator [Salinimicrobium sediminis]|uniref:Response regulator receiver domain-containing protein n=1 Tax=Salinimicrobium sediminis TaxID=1343891 RepID=A0A285X3A1_9FLAO|nr:response regulator [Salinimicrobium sediminis]MDX1601667.1 response regulator [Salinimicrobium sediminis]SOC79785.1 Response regulator receiver domain-containing protein [Salinimicrobium sediminis]